jgi:hypothetical protein
MAAFCSCCGAEITRRVEACPVCGTPRHGMLPLELSRHEDVDEGRSQENVKDASGLPSS